jgi:hypothetical protein
MGEPEDEFAKAEALLQSLEAKQVAPTLQTEAQKTFRVNSYYEAPVELFGTAGLYTNKSVTKLPAQENGDIYPYIVGQGRVRGSDFAVDNKIYYKILHKSEDQSEYVIQIATSGVTPVDFDNIDYLKVADIVSGSALALLYVVRCNAEIFKRVMPITSVKEWPSIHFKRLGFVIHSIVPASVDGRPIKINTAYTDACAKYDIQEQAKKKARADALWAQKNEREFIKNQKLEIKKVAEEVFPGNAYFIDYDVGLHMDDVFIRDYDNLNDKKFETCLLIRFPSFVIINKNGQTHNIKDLWVLIPFDVKGVKAPNTDIYVKKLCIKSNIWGCRSTQTSAEHMSGYRHSHLTSSPSSYNKFTSFCLGGGSSINISVAELSNYFTVERFELFFFDLSSYVKYEIIQGCHYMIMENIVKQGSRSHS